MFFKPHPGLGPQCPICADMFLSIAYKGKQDAERNRKEQKTTQCLELYENCRVSSHQTLTLAMTGWKLRLRNHCGSCNNICTCKRHNISPVYVSRDSLSQLLFPICHFNPSKFDVTRPSNFHKVLQTSVQG